MGLQSMAEELSLVIAEQWKMPPLCQKLVVDEQVLAPPSPLAGCLLGQHCRRKKESAKFDFAATIKLRRQILTFP